MAALAPVHAKCPWLQGARRVRLRLVSSLGSRTSSRVHQSSTRHHHERAFHRLPFARTPPSPTSEQGTRAIILSAFLAGTFCLGDNRISVMNFWPKQVDDGKSNPASCKKESGSRRSTHFMKQRRDWAVTEPALASSVGARITFLHCQRSHVNHKFCNEAPRCLLCRHPLIWCNGPTAVRRANPTLKP